jgi:hypothetical protein
MRKVIETQLKFGQVDIDKIKIDIQSRDEIPQLLLGLQTIYGDLPLRMKIFQLLESIVPEDTSKKTGRPGMDLWEILVLGMIRLNCNFDYDKLVEIANEHKTVREFLGHIDFNDRYALQTVKDNLLLLTPEVLDQIGSLVVDKGHALFGKKDKSLSGRCDSFVVETNVHFPTDINLLWDSMRKMITLIALIFSDLGLTEWRQSEYILRKIKKLFNGRIRDKRVGKSCIGPVPGPWSFWFQEICCFSCACAQHPDIGYKDTAQRTRRFTP